MTKIKEEYYRRHLIETFHGEHGGDYFYCKSNHLKSSHNRKHINGGWSTIAEACKSIKDNLDYWLDDEIKTIEDLSLKITKSLIYDDEFDARIDVNTLQFLIGKFREFTDVDET